mmetsp:Transcript_762/g.2331  ORF Transcript_762/g.2331 Transcript_762/m.2331 type:complete len:239 (+) Transcript_762:469-1185(+)
MASSSASSSGDPHRQRDSNQRAGDVRHHSVVEIRHRCQFDIIVSGPMSSEGPKLDELGDIEQYGAVQLHDEQLGVVVQNGLELLQHGLGAGVRPKLCHHVLHQRLLLLAQHLSDLFVHEAGQPRQQLLLGRVEHDPVDGSREDGVPSLRQRMHYLLLARRDLLGRHLRQPSSSKLGRGVLEGNQLPLGLRVLVVVPESRRKCVAAGGACSGGGTHRRCRVLLPCGAGCAGRAFVPVGG